MYSLFLISPPTQAANEYIEGFEMNSCIENKCTQLIVKGTVEKGILAPLFAFQNAVLIQQPQKGGPSTRLHASEGYYDSSRMEIVLRGVTELNGGESFINLKTGKIKAFARKN